ncbi:MAG TPA: tetraacyldisaccharide 4'-kinase [Pseudomonadales bacterium]|nr:tetraacyldisaccharide 4'-kinase [Pseudomonadales bacterium]
MKKPASEILLSAWYEGRTWFLPFLILLWPLSQCLQVVARIRRIVLQRRQPILSLPVVVIGNIALGGTGKTPLICWLAVSLQARGIRVGIISRGYGGSHTGKPRLVQASDDAAVVGDEPLLLARRTGCPVIVAHDRLAAARWFCAQASVDLILSDDGLQHYRLPRTLEIAVLDGVRGIGNGFCLPAGPLREAPRRLQEVNCVVVNGDTGTVFRDDQYIMQLQPCNWRALHDGNVLPLDFLPGNQRVHAVAGIGNPSRFFATLRRMGLDVIEHAFPDHHRFSAGDLQFGDDLPVVMTEKDEMKCKSIAPQQTYALIVDAVSDSRLPDRIASLVRDK